MPAQHDSENNFDAWCNRKHVMCLSLLFYTFLVKVHFADRWRRYLSNSRIGVHWPQKWVLEGLHESSRNCSLSDHRWFQHLLTHIPVRRDLTGRDCLRGRDTVVKTSADTALTPSMQETGPAILGRRIQWLRRSLGGSLHVSRIFILSPLAASASPSRGGLLCPYAARQRSASTFPRRRTRVLGHDHCGHELVGQSTRSFFRVAEVERPVGRGHVCPHRQSHLRRTTLARWEQDLGNNARRAVEVRGAHAVGDRPFSICRFSRVSSLVTPQSPSKHWRHDESSQ